jgi:hypothetical protein
LDATAFYHQLTWLAILPAALALANFLPHARETGSLAPQRRWLFAGFCAIWMIDTQFLRGRQDLIILPAASILTVLSGPGNWLVAGVQSAPSGLLAVVGSFMLLGIGTMVALTKHRWHRSDEKSA